MLEKIKFINHINEEIQFGQDGIYVNYNDLHDYSWDFTSNNNRISSFKKGIVQKTIPIIICCSSEEEGLKLKNKLMEVCEKDVLSLKHGKLVVGDYYLKCFVTASAKTEYLVNKGFMKAKLTITTDFPKWVKETRVSFRTDGRVVEDGDSGETENKKRNFDFNFDFPFDYMSEMQGKTLNNTGFVGTNFRLIVFGNAVNPAVHVSGHVYEVDCVIEQEEYLTIDSLEKTIVLTKKDGTKVNMFNNRNRNSYIFESIPSGANPVTWNGDWGFDFILLEERSEPKWT